MKNYVIAAEGNQTELKDKITQRPVKVSGITAEDKTYDGTDEATLKLDDIVFTGHMAGDSLKVTVKGAFIKTEDEKPEEVLYTSEGKAGKKKVALVISNLEAGDETTNIDNYCLAEEGQQEYAEAVINPIEITPAKWSIDKKSGLPVVENDNKSSNDNNVETVVRYYRESDKNFSNPIAEDQLIDGVTYVARIE